MNVNVNAHEHAHAYVNVHEECVPPGEIIRIQEVQAKSWRWGEKWEPGEIIAPQLHEPQPHDENEIACVDDGVHVHVHAHVHAHVDVDVDVDVDVLHLRSH